MIDIYNKFMEYMTNTLFPGYKGTNILELKWDYLIVLDAARCDIFQNIYQSYFPKETKFKCIHSNSSSTIEFMHRNIMANPKIKEKLKNIVFINANPMIDNVLGNRIYGLFYRYIPVWKKYWDDNIGTVKPESMYLMALKSFIKYPKNKMIIWFLQPHYPYLDEKFRKINILNKEFMNKAKRRKQENNLHIIIKILKKFMVKGYLCAGIPDTICDMMHQSRKDVTTAYTKNLAYALEYVRKLTDLLPGRIVVTSDHGEAFGEELIKRPFPIHVYGHPSRVHIDSLRYVPYLELWNDIHIRQSIRLTLRELVNVLRFWVS